MATRINPYVLRKWWRAYDFTKQVSKSHIYIYIYIYIGRTSGRISKNVETPYIYIYIYRAHIGAHIGKGRCRNAIYIWGAHRGAYQKINANNIFSAIFCKDSVCVSWKSPLIFSAGPSPSKVRAAVLVKSCRRIACAYQKKHRAARFCLVSNDFVGFAKSITLS